MAKYDFDRIIPRRGSGALKTDALQERFGKDGLLPMWVADLDFATPSFIVDALRQRLEHPIFGYTIEPDDYWPTVMQWIESHHGWKIEKDWITYIPETLRERSLTASVLLRMTKFRKRLILGAKTKMRRKTDYDRHDS